MASERNECADRAAAECVAAAVRLRQLQASLGDALRPDMMTTSMIADIQALDTVTQTLLDLAEVFTTLGADGPSAPDAHDRLFDRIRQESLRERLCGDAPRHDPSIEIF